MEQPKVLDLTGGWDDIVNNVERHNARCRFEEKLAKRKFHKQINKALMYAIGAAMAMVLECTGLFSIWVAIPAALLLVCMACFTAGQIVGKWMVRHGG